MAKNVTNPYNLKILHLSRIEACMIRNSFVATCGRCNMPTASFCYIAATDNLVCPDCMKAFVRSNPLVLNHSKEYLNYVKALESL